MKNMITGILTDECLMKMMYADAYKNKKSVRGWRGRIVNVLENLIENIS